MGITGLLPFIRKSCRSANLRDFSGATVAIDAYSWLHKGAFSCAEKLVKGEKTDGYVFYCAKQLNMLLEIGVKPIMVFDGCNLHSKASTEKKRRENREKTRQRGKELLCEGKVKEARECFQRCVDVTPEMAREVIEMCRKKSVDCIVAPYEADAQLAYLDRIGVAQIIITEDSDLTLFGCNKILFKMDGFGGGLLYEKENLPKSFGSNASKFSFEKFRYICILSGCDYLSSLPGIGLAKASKFFMLTTNPDISAVLKRLPSYLKMPKLEVSDEYIDSFIKANNTFLHQLVFCPQMKKLVPLTPYPEGVSADDMEYAGKMLSDDLAVELAMGDINVKTLRRFQRSDLNSSIDIEKSTVWGTNNELSDCKPAKKVECTAFKFNSHKVKGVKRKAECIENDPEPPQILKEDEELFSMYRQFNSKKDDEYEEDPLAEIHETKPEISSLFSLVKSEANSENVLPGDSKLSLKPIMRSRFFSTKSESTKTAGVLRENSPKKLADEDSAVMHVEIPDGCADKDIKDDVINSSIKSPVKSNKENIAHRFAKKKIDSKHSSNLTSADITSSLTKVERSWLDIIDTESSATTASLSSTDAAKIFSLNAEKGGGTNSNFVKIKKTKLISTKILDFKWNKQSAVKANHDSSLRSDGNSTFESLPECDDDIEVVLDTSKCESPFFESNSAKSDFDCDASKSDLFDQDLSDLPSNRSSAPCRQNYLAESVISPMNLKSPSISSNKPGKCRSIGLSKKSKSFDRKASIKETLMSFNFVRKSKSDVAAT